MKRSWLSEGDLPSRSVVTRFGTVHVRIWSENRINVEVRDEPIVVNRASYRGTFTLKCPAWGTYEMIGRMTMWGGTQITASAQAKLLEELGQVLSKETWIEAEFVMAARRDVNNEIIRADQDIAKAEAALAGLRARREELLRSETALGGRLTPEAGSPAA